jgi:hypothetical protein
MLFPWLLVVAVYTKILKTKPYLIAGLLISCFILFMTPVFPRYGVWLFPIVVLGFSEGIYKLKNKKIVYLILILLIFTNIFSIIPFAVVIPIQDVKFFDAHAVIKNTIGPKTHIRFYLFELIKGGLLTTIEPSEYVYSVTPVHSSDTVYGHSWGAYASEYGTSWIRLFRETPENEDWWENITIAVFLEVPEAYLKSESYKNKRELEALLMHSLEKSGRFNKYVSKERFIYSLGGDNYVFVSKYIFDQYPETKVIWYKRMKK